MRLLGGKKKRKKKVYTKPKKIGHKHKKRPKALLEYFNVDNTGKISKIKIECEKCPAGKPKQSPIILTLIRYLYG
jgi:small subunit ribosomal protein S27Ae